MLHIIERLFAPQGQRDSPFTHAEFVALAEMTPRPWLLATTGDVRGPGITAEFPFYDNVPALLAERAETALFTATATERHPQLGSGALFRLSSLIHGGSGLGQRASWPAVPTT